MIDLKNKAALVTGAGQRVGAAIATALGAEGMRVAVHYRASRDGAEETCRAIRAAGGDAFPIGADLYDLDGARSLIDEAVTRLGGLDLLVPSAANFDAVSFDAIEDTHLERALRLNVEAPFVLTHHARDALRAAKGCVVFITCSSVTQPYRGYAPYVVSKGAVRQLMRVLALELAPSVRVNAVAPGTVLPPESMDEEQVRALVRAIPLERVGTAEDVADAVVALARAPFITGQELIVDGGRTVGG